jgi:uncharacterized membrane protein YphA (DoxX/SURF4 family)
MAKGEHMLAIRVIALVLILAGAVGLTYSGFDDLPSSQEGRAARVELVKGGDLAMWAGLGGLLLGGLLLIGLATRR